MAHLRIIMAIAIVLVGVLSCSLFDQQENFISFTLDGVQYVFTESAGRSDHPNAFGAYQGTDPPYSYVIQGSATAEDALEGNNTMWISMQIEGDSWNVSVVVSDSSGGYRSFEIPDVPDGLIDAWIENRDAVGEQLKGSMPGPFMQVDGSSTLRDINFSVERLPNEEDQG